MTDDPLESLREAVAVCTECATSYAVIGAVARNAWAPPRATTDLDLAIIADTEAYERVRFRA